ncbi:unnamed protein product [Caenorhabditis nigoni]
MVSLDPVDCAFVAFLAKLVWEPSKMSHIVLALHSIMIDALPLKSGPQKPSSKTLTTKSPVAKFPIEIESPTIHIPKIVKSGEKIKKYTPMLAQCLKIYESASLG